MSEIKDDDRICVDCRHHVLEKGVEKYGFLNKKERPVENHMCIGRRNSITGEVMKIRCWRSRRGDKYTNGWCYFGKKFEPK